MRALITGIGGFVGRHLLAHLRSAGDEVIGLARPEDVLDLALDIEVVHANLLERASVERAVRQIQPEAVYHLAAQSSTGNSLDDPWGTLENNLRGQMNLFEALLAARLRPHVLVVGSSDEYGRVRPDQLPTTEDVPLQPVTPYAVSKVGQDVMAYQYFAQHGLPTVRVRPFSHTGPGQDGRFVVPNFARQLAEIEAGAREPVVRVGNLDVERDITDVRDVVQAYRLAVTMGEPGNVYNLGRGQGVLLRDVLDDLRGMCHVAARVETDPILLRPADVPRQQAGTERFRRLTGWQPSTPWQTTLHDTLSYWRVRVGVGALLT